MQRIVVGLKRKACRAYLVATFSSCTIEHYLIAMPVHSYVLGAKDSVKLLDIVASAEDTSLDLTGVPVARRPALYPDVWMRCLSSSTY